MSNGWSGVSSYKGKEWDIDVLHDKSGWKCSFWHNNHQVCATAYFQHRKDAVSDMKELLDKLPSFDRPSDLKKIIWNPDQDNTKWSSSGNGLGGTVTSYSHCDHDPDDELSVAFSIGKVKIIGATKSCIKALGLKSKKKRLIINCSGDKVGSWSVKDKPIKQFGTPLLEETFGKKDYKMSVNFGDEMILDWADQAAAPVRPEFWVDLLDFIKSDTFPYSEVVFCCIGGHGRTGTALSSLALVAETFKGKKVTFKNDPNRIATQAEVAECYVKDRYCEKAVESQAQVDYLDLVEAFISAK